MNKKALANIFKETAKKYGVTPEEVELGISKAIEIAWRGNGVKAAQDKVLCEGDVPTSEELIAYIVRRVKGK